MVGSLCYSHRKLVVLHIGALLADEATGKVFGHHQKKQVATCHRRRGLG